MKKFDLTKAAGLDRIVSNLDTMEITQIPLDLIDTNEKNFFSVDDVQDLMESIQVNGILQPLNVVRAGDRYRIIAGHRRFKAAGEAGLKEVPAIVLPDMSESMEWFALIKTNTTARELSYSEKMKAVKQVESMVIQLRDEGVKLPGRLRDVLSQQLEISKTELARMSVIEKHLSSEWKDELFRNNINASCAYELARLSNEDQAELFTQLRSPDNETVSYMSAALVEDYKVRKQCQDWIRQNCTLASGSWASELRAAGKQVPCKFYKDVLSHKQKGHPERCCGCCAECDHVEECKDKCQYAKSHLEAKATKEKNERHITEQQALYKKHPIKKVVDALNKAIDDSGYDAPGLTAALRAWFDLNQLPTWRSLGSFEVEGMMNCEQLVSVPSWLAVAMSIFDVLDIDPNLLFGCRDATALGRWHAYPEERPKENQKVVIRRTVGNITRCGEYIYRDGEWYEPGLDDFKMNITGVTHWIEGPEGET